MRKIVMVALLCWVISSCGIFKKTNKAKEEFKASVELGAVESKQVTANTSTSVGVVENRAVKDRSTSSKSIRADRMRILPDGSIEADGNVLYDGFDQKELDSLKQKEAFENSNADYFEVANSRLRYKAEIKEVVKTSESETDGVGLLFGAVAVLVVAFGVMWWFFGRG